MAYEDLLQQARRSELFQDQATQGSAVKAVLGILASRLDEEPARKLASVLPKPLTYDTLRGHQANITNITAEQYFETIADQFSGRKEHAQRLVTLILGAVAQNLPDDALTAIRGNLPPDWNELLPKGSASGVRR